MEINYYLNEQVPERRTSIYERGTPRNLPLSNREACILLNEKQVEIERLRGERDESRAWIRRHYQQWEEWSPTATDMRVEMPWLAGGDDE